MPMTELTLEQIVDLAPEIVATFNQRLRLAAADCEDRSNDGKARTVSLEVKMTPVENPSTRTCDKVEVAFSCTGKVPANQTQTYSIAISKTRAGTALLFNPDSPDNVDQSTFDMGRDRD